MQTNRRPAMAHENHGDVVGGAGGIWGIGDEDAAPQARLQPAVGRDRRARPQLDLVTFPQPVRDHHSPGHQRCHHGRGAAAGGAGVTPGLVVCGPSADIPAGKAGRWASNR